MRDEHGDTYEKWFFDRLDNIKKREARDQLSHDRWVSARKRLEDGNLEIVKAK